MYVMAETLAGLRDGIIGCLRLRELALDRLKANLRGTLGDRQLMSNSLPSGSFSATA
jgi:hypothetical protein